MTTATVNPPTIDLPVPHARKTDARLATDLPARIVEAREASLYLGDCETSYWVEVTYADPEAEYGFSRCEVVLPMNQNRATVREYTGSDGRPVEYVHLYRRDSRDGHGWADVALQWLRGVAAQAPEADRVALQAMRDEAQRALNHNARVARFWKAASTPEVGAEVQVVRGRKVKLGSVGTVRWQGENQWGTSVGLELPDAPINPKYNKPALQFTSIINVERTEADLTKLAERFGLTYQKEVS